MISSTRYVVLLLLCLCCSSLWSLAQQPQLPKVGDVIFSTDFDGKDIQNGWTGWSDTVQLDQGYQSAHALLVSNPVGKEAGSVLITRKLPVEQMRGCTITFSAMVKGENISQKPKPWNGVKYMLFVDAKSGKNWPQGAIPVGTFDWRPVTFQVKIPDDASAMNMSLGLEQVSGKVWFDNIKITASQVPAVATDQTTAQAINSKAGDVIYTSDFEDKDVQTGWSGTVQLDQGYQSTHAMLVSNAVGKEAEAVLLSRKLPVEQIRGCTITFSAMVKGENISQKPKPWNGVKYMLFVDAKSGKNWPQGAIPMGTFDWCPVTFQVKIPDDASAMNMSLGIEHVSGKVWFDNIKITVSQAR
ncbi:MAG TPA: hypothetical protein VHV83_12680 [Armatimonadota bacterium]|nr:hypothetical protein [Armatimonadota bacterium]